MKKKKTIGSPARNMSRPKSGGRSATPRPTAAELSVQNVALRRAQEELEVSNALYADLYNRAPVGHVTLNHRGKVQAANFATCMLIGHSRNMIVGLPFVLHVMTADVKKFLNHLHQCHAGQAIERVELRLKHRNQRPVPVELHTMALPDHFETGAALYRTTIIDLTERQRAGQALQESEERYRILAETLPHFILVADAAGNINYCNTHSLQFMGLNPDEIGNQKWLEMIHPDDRRLAQRKWDMAVQKRRGVRLELRYQRKSDSAYLWHQCRFFPVRDAGGNVVKILSIAIDIQSRKVAEAGQERLLVELKDERASLAERVRERTASLRTLNKKLRAEIAGRKRLEQEILEISESERRRFGQDLHDSVCQQIFGTALMVNTLVERLKEKNAPESEYAKKIAKLLTSSVQEARSLSHGLYPQIFDTDGLVSALNELAITTGENLKCRFECGRNVRVRNKIAALNFYRIAQEAVANAVKHSKAKEVVIRLYVSRGRSLLSISDNGIGLPKNVKTDGMGFDTMGYRARIIGGSLIIRSRKNEGTTILCSLPEDCATGSEHHVKN